MFLDPEIFRPERFIDTMNPRLKQLGLPFEFGRRACSGMHLALNSLFINISRILWAFEIRPGSGAEFYQVRMFLLFSLRYCVGGQCVRQIYRCERLYQ